ncbi:MAG: phospho-sugar mutase [Candidatus Saccharimonadales bacterium]
MNTEQLHDHLSDAAVANIEKWLTEPKYAEYKDELNAMIEKSEWQALEDAFFKVIEFGTGGRRGTTGVGSNRINRVTIGESTQALCQYALTFDENAASKGVVIACDTRLSSEELSTYAASVCAANGFKTYIFESFRSTPELSFAVRHLGCAAGIVISASHNPPADNGFKAYWSDGGQLVAPHDKGVLAAADKITEIFSTGYSTAVSNGQITVISEEIDTAYIDAVLAQAEGSDRDVTIVYSPLHGAGQRNTLPVLEKAGFTVSSVVAQMVPDGHFPTIENGKPNPEERAANDQAVAQMMAEKADIAVTNDPDADRIGVMVRHHDAPVYLTGNQSAVLAAEYTLRKKHEKSELTGNEFIAKTIVTTDMFTALADAYHVKCYGNLLIGFKYIGELILKLEGKETFLIGGEESYGLLKGDYARDKDGAVGALPLAEYAAELKKDGKTLYDRLLELYAEHGVYIERLDTVECPGANGFEQMQHIMNTLRATPITEIHDQTVTAVIDYQTLIRTDLSTRETTKVDCITGNVIVLECNNDPRCRFTIRPSGTEPKLKIYSQWYEDVTSDVEAQYGGLSHKLESLGESLEGILLSI